MFYFRFCSRCYNTVKRPPFYIRVVILVCVGAFAPIGIHHIVYKLWDVSVLRAAEITFLLCIPIAFWMADRINERWHDDRED